MRRLVICCDGTWNDRGTRVTNIARIAQLVAPTGTAPDGSSAAQVVYYDPGVGTERSLLSKLSGGAFGEGLSSNVLDAYRFIVDNYAEGDELWFFGFSRGAFTVRSLSGLIRKSGILRKAHSDLAQRAFDLYRARSRTPEDRASRNGVDGEPALSFRRDHSVIPASIQFIGVFDTVGAIGIPVSPRNVLYYFARRKWGFHDVDLSTRVRFGYQALAIDERRPAFTPSIWNVQAAPAGVTQTVEQRWFPGVHSDVGGGLPERGLAETALRWMLDRASAAGLAVDPAYAQPEDPSARLANPLDVLHESRTGFYRLLGAYVRPLGFDDGQVLSHAAHRRLTSSVTPPYEPQNVRRYLVERDALAKAGGAAPPVPTSDYA